MPDFKNINEAISNQEKRLKNLETKRARVSVDAVIGAGSTSGSSGVAAAFWVDTSSMISIQSVNPEIYYYQFISVTGGTYDKGRQFSPFTGTWNIKHDLNRTVMLAQLIDINSSKPYNSLGLQAKNVDANNYQLVWNGGFTTTSGLSIILNRSFGNTTVTITGSGSAGLFDNQLVYIDVGTTAPGFPATFLISRPNPTGTVTVNTSGSTSALVNVAAKIYPTTPYGTGSYSLRAILVG